MNFAAMPAQKLYFIDVEYSSAAECNKTSATPKKLYDKQICAFDKQGKRGFCNVRR